MTKEKKGLVVDVDLKKAVILTPSGEFIAVKLAKGEPIPSIGEEHSFQPKKVFNLKYNSFIKYAALVAALLIFVFIPSINNAITTSRISLSQMESYLVIDINPSIELGLDSSDYVRNVKPLNQDGEHVLKNADVIGKPLKEVVKQIIDTAIELGYLKEKGESQNIIFTYVPTKTDASTEINKNELVEEVASSLVEKRITANVEAIVTNENTRQEANKLGLSTGKYVIFCEALENGLDITPEELQSESLGKAITKSGGDLEQLLKQAKKEKTAQKIAEKIDSKIRKEIEKKEAKELKLDYELKESKHIIKDKILDKIRSKTTENGQEAKESKLDDKRQEVEHTNKAEIQNGVSNKNKESNQKTKKTTRVEVEKKTNKQEKESADRDNKKSKKDENKKRHNSNKNLKKPVTNTNNKKNESRSK